MNRKKISGLAIGLLFFTLPILGQNLLSRSISIEVSRQRLDNVLEILSNQGNFYFSYNSAVVRKDSLVNLNVRNRSLKEVLDLLFDGSYEFRESGNYIIIRKQPIRLTMVTNKAVAEERIYSVSGYVYDDQSGTAINEASVYEKRLLSAALTNNEGYFKLKLKSGRSNTAELTVSKEFYEDTTVTIEPRHSQQLTITMMPFDRPEDNVVVTPEDYLVADTLQTNAVVKDNGSPVNRTFNDSGIVERTRMGRFLLSAKQRAQSINLKRFFTTRPYQVSLVPGLGSHGRLSGQVVNNFSLNLFGGYTAGTNGLEVGGLFNIDKKDVKYAQVAGLFNIVGGRVKGLQVAGLSNTVLDSVAGLQVGGINNLVKGNFKGMQVSGIYNHVTDSMKGLQVAGLANFSRRKVSGVQIAGVLNFSNKETEGVQISGVFNYSKRLRGLQIGLINVSDTSEGFSIGLINVVFKGYHKLTISTNEVMQFNAAFKTGHAKFYNILFGGLNTGSNNKVLSFGYGLGSEFMLNKRRTVSLNPELTSQYLYLGSMDYTNLLNKLHLNVNVKVGKFISLFAGPSFSVYVSDQKAGIAGYRFPIPPSGYKAIKFSDKVNGWFGWNAGISIF